MRFENGISFGQNSAAAIASLPQTADYLSSAVFLLVGQTPTAKREIR